MMMMMAIPYDDDHDHVILMTLFLLMGVMTINHEVENDINNIAIQKQYYH